MKTPLIVVIVIVAGILGFLTIYSQQSGEVVQATSPAAVAAGNVSAAPAPVEK